MKPALACILFISAVAPVASAQVETVFRGRPTVQISQGGDQHQLNKLSGEKAEQYDLVISKIGDEYFWATRENRPLVRVDAGAYITYIAAGGGYIKIVKPEMKNAAGVIDAASAKYDYVEHITLGISSIVYYGRRR